MIRGHGDDPAACVARQVIVECLVGRRTTAAACDIMIDALGFRRTEFVARNGGGGGHGFAGRWDVLFQVPRDRSGTFCPRNEVIDGAMDSYRRTATMLRRGADGSAAP